MSKEDRNTLSDWVLSQLEKTLTESQLTVLISYSKDYLLRESDPNQVHFHINVYSSIGNVV